jgi:hypothetical protein
MPKRDFPSLLTAFLAAAATGATIGGAKEAKADTGFQAIVVCDEDGFCEFGETLPFNEGPFDESFFQVVEPFPPILPPIFPPFPFP